MKLIGSALVLFFSLPLPGTAQGEKTAYVTL